MDKISLNRTIVSMRGVAVQAKVHAIHHLTTQIKKLKCKKTKTDEQKSQNERKISRAVEEVLFLKKVRKDNLVKFALMNEMSQAELMQKENKTGKIDIQVRAFIRVSSHKAISSKVNQFREENSQWRKELKKLLPTLGQSTRLKERQVKTMIKKAAASKKTGTDHDDGAENDDEDEENEEEKNGDQKSSSEDDGNQSKDDDIAKESGENSGGDSESEAEDHVPQVKAANKTSSASGTDNDEPISDEEADSDSGSIASHRDTSLFKDIRLTDEEMEFSDTANNSDEELFVSSIKSSLLGALSSGGDNSTPVQKTNKVKTKSLEKNSGSVLVKVLDLKEKANIATNEDSDSEVSHDDSDGDESEMNTDSDADVVGDQIESDSDSVEEEAELIPSPEKPKSNKRSSFFMGGESDSEEGENDEKNYDGESQQKLRKDESFFIDKIGKSDRGGGSRGRISFGNSSRGRRRGGDNSIDYRGRSSKGGRGSRGGFGEAHRGRGSDFRERGAEFRGRGYSRRSRGGENNRGMTKRPHENGDKEHLHPSWAAKKQAKTDIVQFQGKKTVFGENGDSSAVAPIKPSSSPSKKSTKDVHPSWAAKQSQKASIQPFQGKKIVFDD